MALKAEILAGLPDFCDAVPYQIKAIAVRDACDALTANKIKAKATGQPFELRFRSRKAPRQSAFIPNSAVKAAGIYPRVSGKGLRYGEPLPERPKDSRLSFQQGRWHLCVPFADRRRVAENQGRVVAIDPGVRTFATFFAERSMGKIGEGDFAKITRLCLCLDGLISRMASSGKRKKRHLQRAVDRLRWRIRDLISELHFKAARFLVDNFDIILLPTFEVSRMARKANRKIRSKSVRSMLTLSHYRFSQILESKAFELGKRVVRVSEAYTSKTNSWTGEVNAKLGGAKSIRVGEVMIDRDINGARGILLRALRDTSIERCVVNER